MASDKLNICYVLFDFNSDIKINPDQFRGFMAHMFSNVSEFHHHSGNSYHYPLIQYKRIGDKLSIVGIGEYSKMVAQSMPNIDHITTQNEKIPIHNIQIKNSIFIRENKFCVYSFVTPWIALNELNYEKYRNINKSEKKRFLEKILVGNILSMFKGLGIFVTEKVEITILKQFSKPITVHDNKFVGFKLDFACNTTLPEYLGLGKSVSKGFGVIRKLN
jgi:hypothetical protein